MSIDAVQEYRQAHHAYHRARATHEQLVRHLEGELAKFRRCRETIVAGVPGVDFPPALGNVIQGDQTIRAQDWPSAGDLGRCLLACQQAYQALRAAWQGVPFPDRAELQPPP